MKRTKIICTVGPACDNAAILLKMIKSGMNIARLNFSHNTHDYHGGAMKKIRAAAKKAGVPVAIIQDLQGPRIRLGDFNGKVVLSNGGKIVLTTGRQERGAIPVTYLKMHKDVRPGERILIADGAIELEVNKVVDKKIYCSVRIGGEIVSHKGINLPDSRVSLSALSEKDIDDLKFGVEQGVDFVALSFVRDDKDIVIARKLAKNYARRCGAAAGDVKIIAKIERREAVDNIDKIISAADAIMIARGDLGIELSTEDVPLAQKMIIEKCLKAIKPVIVATQMLESMVNGPRPTRAEASDVANAVIDHADALMLSGETANGRFPIFAVMEMAKIIEKTEASRYDDLDARVALEANAAASKILSGVARILAENIKAKVLLVSGGEELGRAISGLRPELPVFLICKDERGRRQALLSWGIFPVVAKDAATAMKILKKNKKIKNGNKIVVVSAGKIYVEIA